MVTLNIPDDEFFRILESGKRVEHDLINTPKTKEQALSLIQYGVVFFDRDTNSMGNAEITKHAVETLSNRPEAAIIKFMDKVRPDIEWEVYKSAGWKVRKIELVDCGDS